MSIKMHLITGVRFRNIGNAKETKSEAPGTAGDVRGSLRVGLMPKLPHDSVSRASRRMDYKDMEIPDTISRKQKSFFIVLRI